MPVPTNLDNEGTRASQLYAASLATYTLAVIAVSCRFLCRRLLKSGYGFDDWFSIAALLPATGFLASTLVWTHQGYGKHYGLLDYDLVMPFQKTIFVGLIFYCLTITFAKLSILCFCWRIFSASTSIRLPIYILIGTVLAWTLAFIFTTIFQCDPVSGFWNHTKHTRCNVDYDKFVIGSAIPNILTDVAMMALPLPYIWRMNRSRSQKIALAGVFLVGGFVIIVSIVKVAILRSTDLKSADLDYMFAPLVIWSASEQNIAIVCACLPSCRPILTFVLTGSLRPTGPSGRAPSRGFGLSWLFKSKSVPAASKKDGGPPYPYGDNRQLVARRNMDHRQSWLEATNFRSTVTGPASGEGNPWDFGYNTAQGPSESWHSGKRTDDTPATKSDEDIEMQMDSGLGGRVIVVKNDVDLRYWTAEGKQTK